MDYIFKLFTIVFVFCNTAESLVAQNDTINDISAFIYLDSFVVVASKAGFNTTEFIDMVREDESFLEAFHNLRFTSYTSTNDFIYYNNKGKEKAQYMDTIYQRVEDNCRTMSFIETDDSGNYFKRRKDRDYNYFTSVMHDRLFYTHQRTCADPNPEIINNGASRIARYIYELKKLVFKPGEPADVPFIGDKTSIFTDPMRQYYDFKISNEKFNNKLLCYAFEVKVKPEFEDKNKVVIKHLKTYFDKATFQVVGRDYQLQYSAGLYQFDVNISIELTKINSNYYPKIITYDGYWNVPIKKKETSIFTLKFFNFETSAP